MRVQPDCGPVRSAWASVGLAVVLTVSLFAALPLLGRLPPAPEEALLVQPVEATPPPPVLERVPVEPENVPRPEPVPQRVAPPQAPELPVAMPVPRVPVQLAMNFDASLDQRPLQFDVRSLPATAGVPGNQIWGIDQLSGRPQFIRRTSPVYPSRARLRGLEGQVELQIVFNEEGQVQELEVLSSDHNGLFDRAAMAAVKSWQIKPMTRNGTPVSVRFTQVVDFYLKASR